MLEDVATSLWKMAFDLRPPVYGRFVSIILLAQKLGLRVRLTITSAAVSRKAHLVMDTQGEIVLFRSGPSPASLLLGAHDEHLLRPSERFSIAHEMGHWLAFMQFGLSPIEPTKGNASEYWRQERIFNRFAGRVMVPDWLIQSWLSDRASHEPIAVKELNQLSTELRISRIVIAARICERMENVGFLELNVDAADDSTNVTFRVAEVATGSAFKLPNIHKLIRDHSLSELFEAASGSRYFARITIDGIDFQDCFVSWAFDGARPDRLWSAWTKVDPNLLGRGSLL